MTVRILRGDVRDRLQDLPDESVHCVVTSPPYWGLRDYGVEGQLGLEATPEAYIDAMVEVFRDVHRVLREDGTLWLNIGDSYVSAPNGNHGNNTTGLTSAGRYQERAPRPHQSFRRDREPVGGDRHRAAPALKPKDLVGIPWMLAFALRAEGWYLRQDIIWHKPNPMPESVRDRCTKAHEYLFLLSKSERYYYDLNAVLEPLSPNTHLRISQASLAEQEGSARAVGKDGNMKAVVRGAEKPPSGWNTGTGRHDNGLAGNYKKVAQHGEGIKNNTSFDEAMAMPGRSRSGNKVRITGADRGIPGAPTDGSSNGAVASGIPWEGYQRNKRSVWTVTTQPFKEAHFATFPTALIEPCILAGCPEGGTVLDPFGGAGTTGLVADRHHRDAILIELNPDYADMAERRILGDSPLFAKVGT